MMEVGLRRALVAICLGLAVLTSCAKQESVSVHSAAGRPMMTIRVESSDKTNGGSVMHMMLRSARPSASTVVESYEQAVGRLMSSSEDDSVLATSPIFPGATQTLSVEKVDPKIIMLYFFFTDPGRRWRAQVESPLPDRVVVRLGAREIQELKREVGN